MIKQVKFFMLISMVCSLFMVPRASFADKKIDLKEAEGKIYYTAVNIWYEDPAKIPSTNYHKGQILPVNTQVTIGTIRKSRITFSDGNNVKYAIEIVSKHTPIPLERVFKNYFSEKQFDLNSLNGEERKNVEVGIISEGMSKAAVIVAYGYPPAHMTPSLDRNPWKYWKDRFRNFYVFFNKDGKVARIGDE